MKVMALLMTHVLCNEMAAIQLMTQEQSVGCSANFEQVKIALNPDLTWNEYQELDVSERSEQSVVSFKFYLDWKAANPDIFHTMVEQAKVMVQARAGGQTTFKSPMWPASP